MTQAVDKSFYTNRGVIGLVGVTALFSIGALVVPDSIYQNMTLGILPELMIVAFAASSYLLVRIPKSIDGLSYGSELYASFVSIMCLCSMFGWISGRLRIAISLTFITFGFAVVGYLRFMMADTGLGEVLLD